VTILVSGEAGNGQALRMVKGVLEQEGRHSLEREAFQGLQCKQASELCYSIQSGAVSCRLCVPVR
jgi:hypothetical protein